MCGWNWPAAKCLDCGVEQLASKNVDIAAYRWNKRIYTDKRPLDPDTSTFINVEHPLKSKPTGEREFNVIVDYCDGQGEIFPVIDESVIVPFVTGVLARGGKIFRVSRGGS